MQSSIASKSWQLRLYKPLSAIKIEMKYIYLLMFLALFSCKTDSSFEELNFHGNINDKVNCDINLKIAGNKLKGTLINTHNKQRINLRGTIVKDFIRIEEFANKNQLTGIFEGHLKEGRYIGNWISPDRKTAVPFTFEKRVNNETTINEQEKINYEVAYINWAIKKNAGSSHYCTKKQCEEDNQRLREGLEPKHGCGLMISQSYPKKDVIFTDLNKDGIEDAIIHTNFEPCMMGTAFINVSIAGYLTVFISSKSGELRILEEPKEVVSNIGMGRITEVKDDTILAEGRSISGKGGMHEVDLFWTAMFRFEEDKFKLLSKSEEVYNGE